MPPSPRVSWPRPLGLSFGAALTGSVLLLACTPRAPGASRRSAEDNYARCTDSADKLAPLLVEWSSTRRSALEAELERSGDALIVVRYTGCEMEVLRDCEARGRYEWTEVSRKRDRIEISDASDVWTKIPLAAAKLVGAVERYGALQLDMALVGQFAGPSVAPPRASLSGRRCGEATHVVSSLIVGAFEITQASGGRVSAGAELAGAGAGVGTSQHRAYFSSDGELRACQSSATTFDATGRSGPSKDCKSLLQLELAPLGPAGEGSEAGETSARRCPEGMAFIEINTESAGSGSGSGSGYAFCLDRHEVTVAEYAECAADHTCSEAPATVDWPGIDEEQHTRDDDLCNRDKSGRRKHPVNCLTHDQAASYCRAQQKRLPASYEWVYAARGGEQNRTYPWGEDAPDHHLVNACGRECARSDEATEGAYQKSDGHLGTAPVGSFPDGTARWDLVDLAGNVREWTSDRQSGGVRVYGGSASSETAIELTAYDYALIDPRSRRFDVGMRCAVAPLPAPEPATRQRRRRR